MDRTVAQPARRTVALVLLAIGLGSGTSGLAADPAWIVPDPAGDLPVPPPRYFPRSDGESNAVPPPPPRRRLAGCTPWRVPVPSDAPGDPSYVGSPYGLGKPSYYGFTPPLGHDDPFGRPLRYCP